MNLSYVNNKQINKLKSTFPEEVLRESFVSIAVYGNAKISTFHINALIAIHNPNVLKCRDKFSHFSVEKSQFI